MIIGFAGVAFMAFRREVEASIDGRLSHHQDRIEKPPFRRLFLLATHVSMSKLGSKASRCLRLFGNRSNRSPSWDHNLAVDQEQALLGEAQPQ